jgi:pyridoxal phosphate-dependent aminotransferase EpsN
VDAFEKEFCAYIGAQHAAAVSSGTAALHLALQLSGVTAGDEVACSTFTFAGSAFPITYVGATPVFIDSEADSWNMDPQLLEDAVIKRKALGKRIKTVVLVHLYGQSANIDPIADICSRHDLLLIEDAAESLGATYKGRHTGTYGHISIFSFNGNKIITTSGGGMIVANDSAIIDKARFLATQARDPAPHYQHSQIGYNYRMSNVLAGIGRGQLTALASRVETKRKIFAYYAEKLLGRPEFSLMPEAVFGRSNRWLTCMIIDPDKQPPFTAEQLRLKLEQDNIESRPLWKPMHLQPVFVDYPAYTSGVSEYLFNNGICLPSGTTISHNDLDRVLFHILN